MCVVFSLLFDKVSEWGKDSEAMKSTVITAQFTQHSGETPLAAIASGIPYTLRVFRWADSTFAASDALFLYRAHHLKRPLVHMGALLDASMVMNTNRSE